MTTFDDVEEIRRVYELLFELDATSGVMIQMHTRLGSQGLKIVGA